MRSITRATAFCTLSSAAKSHVESGSPETPTWQNRQPAGAFSPDGRWLAYHSDESGLQEVYVADYPGGQTRRLVSVHPGEGKEPAWSPLGDEIFYRSDGSLYAVSVVPGDTLAVGTPRRLFRGPYVTVGGPEFDVAPDAQRFLMLREPLQATGASVGLVTGFFERLNRLAPPT